MIVRFVAVAASILVVTLVFLARAPEVPPEQTDQPAGVLSCPQEIRSMPCANEEAGVIIESCKEDIWSVVLNTCAVQQCDALQDEGCGNGDYLSLGYAQSQMLLNLIDLGEDERLYTRYLLLNHKLVSADHAASLATYEQAINKALNSLNTKHIAITRAVAVDAQNAVYRIDLRNYNLEPTDWAAIKEKDPFRLPDDTAPGMLLRQLTGTDTNPPWMHFDNFIDTVFRNSDLYYQLTDTPGTFAGLVEKMGCNYQGEIASLTAMFLGAKNRLLTRHLCLVDRYYFYATYDTDVSNGLQESPLIQDAREALRLAHSPTSTARSVSRGEVIYQLANGLQGYAVFAANKKRKLDQRLDSGEIHSIISCHSCHAGGLIPVSDQTRAMVEASRSKFAAEEVEAILGLYKPNEANLAAFTRDAATFSGALTQIDVDTSVDPINHAVDELHLDWGLADVAHFFFLTPEEFSERVNLTTMARQQTAELLRGGTMTYDQLVEITPNILAELNLFKDENQ